MRIFILLISLSLSSPALALQTDIQKDASRLLTNPPSSIRNETDLGCLAVTIYHESRGEPVSGQVAVGSVVLNRVQDKRWPNSVCRVIKQPVQFSYLKRSGGPLDYDHAPIKKDKHWELAVKSAAHSLMNGPLPELWGADHYHADYVNPVWNKKMRRVGKIGAHIFFDSN
jgi:spore germination cell wall hydrolase CwlJ-like protein